ncbi:MAG: TonB C-terminal domain-containing protein [Deltaproteobacteria bacterium]|jgi:colicin import membrane protein|nr:TonB C-terminal domain-containing protein [Deltaproteobacteria bacterium]
MKGIADPYAYRLQGVEGDRKTLFLTFAVSGICHLLLFAIFIFFPNRAWDRKSPPSFINVSIVTLSALEKGPTPYDKPSIEPEKQATTQKKRSTPTAKAIPVAAQKPSEAISVRKKTKKPKRSLKKKTFKTAKVVKSAVDKIEKRVEASRPDQITRAIDRLRDQVEKNGIAEQKKHPGEANSRALEGAGGKQVLELIVIYQHDIALQIEKNWAFSEQLAGERTDLVAELAFTVMPSGEIRDIWFDKRSGNKYLDDSAKKAIMKSNPVKPHPSGIRKPYMTMGLRFTPKGVE